MADTMARKRNRAPLLGLLLTVLGALSNGLPFTGFPAAPVPWISLLLSLIGFAVALFGLWRAFGQSTVYRGKLSSAVTVAFSLLFFSGAIVFFWGARHIPRESADAPQVGQRVPDFTLPDSTGQSVSLTRLFSGSAEKEPPKALLLIFYRGYW
jgi:ABC-type transport system involved in multi-copper enzyme maturation permease subunit